tara:strand:+ start:3442 stop:3765 length:324 start_codon:yes stop_codon:yes gene_type:complete
MGIKVSVFRHGQYDCTNGGISSKATELCIVNLPGSAEPSEDCPAARLIVRSPCGNPILSIVPDGEERWTMFGGNYAACSGNGFSEACSKALGHAWYGAVAIHDRIEG